MDNGPARTHAPRVCAGIGRRRAWAGRPEASDQALICSWARRSQPARMRASSPSSVQPHWRRLARNCFAIAAPGSTSMSGGPNATACLTDLIALPQPARVTGRHDTEAQASPSASRSSPRAGNNVSGHIAPNSCMRCKKLACCAISSGGRHLVRVCVGTRPLSGDSSGSLRAGRQLARSRARAVHARAWVRCCRAMVCSIHSRGLSVGLNGVFWSRVASVAASIRPYLHSSPV